MTKIKSPLKHDGLHSPHATPEGYHEAQGGVHNGIDYGEGTVVKRMNKKKKEQYEKRRKEEEKKVEKVDEKVKPIFPERAPLVPISEGPLTITELWELDKDIISSYTKKDKDALREKNIKLQLEKKVEMSMQPYVDSGMYSEDELGIIRVGIKNNDGDDPNAISFDKPSDVLDNFVDQIILENIGPGSCSVDPDRNNTEDLCKAVGGTWISNKPEDYGLSKSEMIQGLINFDELDWEDVLHNHDSNIKHHIDPRNGLRVKKVIQTATGLVATEWYEDKKFSWEWQDLELPQESGWYNHATGKYAPFNSKSQHPMLEGIIEEDLEDEVLDLLTYDPRFDHRPDALAVAPTFYELQTIAEEEDKITLLNKVERIRKKGEDYGYDKDGKVLNDSKIRVDKHGIDPFATKEESSPADFPDLESDHQSGYTDFYSYPEETAIGVTLSALTLDPTIELAKDLGFELEYSPSQYYAYQNYFGSEEQKADKDYITNRGGTKRLNIAITEKTKEVVYDQINEVSEEHYLTKEEQDISKLLKDGKFKQASKLVKELGLPGIYDENGNYVSWEDVESGEIPISSYFITREPEIEEDAKDLISQDVAIEDLEDSRAQKVFNLKTIADELTKSPPVEISYLGKRGEILTSYKDKIKSDRKYLDTPFFYAPDKFDKAWETIEEFSIADGLISGLEYLPEGHPLADQWNDELRAYKVVNRALEINADITREKVTRTEALLQGLGFDETEKEIIAFEEEMVDLGKQPKNDFNRWSDKTRNIKSTTETVKVIAEIGASIYVMKKIPIGIMGKGKTLGTGTRFKTLGGAITAWKRQALVGTLRSMPIRTKLLDGIVTVGVASTAEVITLALADPVGGAIFGSQPFIIDVKTGEIYPEGIMFAATLGAMNPTTRGILKTIGKTKVVKKALFTADEFARHYKHTFPSFRKALGTKALEAGVGTVTLLAADYVATKGVVDYSMWKEMHYASKADMMENYGRDHIMNNYIALFTYGGVIPGRGNTVHTLYEAYRSDIARYRGTTKWAIDGSKILGFEKPPTDKDGYTTNAINKKLREKKSEVEKSDLSIKEKNEKIEKLKKAANDMHFDNKLRLVNKMVEVEDMIREEKEEVFMLYLKAKSGEKLTGQEMYDFGRLTDLQLDYYKVKLGIVTENYDRVNKCLDKEAMDSEANKHINELHN